MPIIKDASMPGSSLFRLQSHRFWLVLLTLALVAALAALRLVFLVEPGLNVEINFSRQQALDAAATFQRERFPALTTQRTAAAFLSDRDFQNYVELEAGGVEAYKTLIPELAAATHFWHVRAFAPGQKHELITDFSPRGDLIAFNYLLPEEDGSVALDEAAARRLAEDGARALLGPRFADYAPIETKQEMQTSGRVDFDFTYEHRSLQPGAARLRLGLAVAGDQLVAVQNRKFTPEAFRQRFGELRALNTQLSQLANGLMLGVFGLGGLLGGGIWLYRRHQLQFRYGLVPALVVSTGLAAAQIANLPIQWMSYQTQTSEQSFILQQLAQAGIVLVATGLLFGAIYAVAEGLARHAFAQQPRLWSSLQTPVAGSRALAGRVLGAYAWTGFFLLYALGFLLFSSRVLDWWQPSSLNVDPNVLASWRPALAPIFNALQAGTWEECFFRAIPLSLAVLLDRHYGSGRKLTLLMLVFQALVFGAAHASYPQLPGYSRVVELMIPALVFGLVFLRFGLVPCMITHFLYDLVLMSMPIFIADNASLWLDRILVVLAGATPLLVVLHAARRQGGLQELPAAACNGEQPLPLPQVIDIPETPATPLHTTAPFNVNQKLLLAVSLISLTLYAAFIAQPARLNWPHFTTDRAAALLRAEQALAQYGVSLQGVWRTSVQIQADSRASLEFVWREAGPAAAQRLLGSYVEAPQWIASWRRFDGPVEERAESWQVRLTPDGELLQLMHQLPEDRAGASLDQAEAEALARAWLEGLQWTPTQDRVLQAVAETKRPARSDWLVTFEDVEAFDHGAAKAVSVVRIAGDEIVGYYRSLDLPEAWVRAEAETASQRQPFRVAGMLMALVLVGCALSPFFRKHSGRRFNWHAALPWLALVLLPHAGLSWLRFDAVSQAFQTTMAWNTQVLIQLGSIVLSGALLGAIVAMAAQAIYTERPRGGATPARDALLGGGLALGVLGLSALGALLLESREPPLPLVADYATTQPALAVLLNSWRGLAASLVVLILALGCARFIQQRWQFWLLAALALGYWIAGGLAQQDVAPGLMALLPTVASVALGYLLIRRGQLGAAMMLAGTLVVLRQWTLLHAVYPAAWAHAALGFTGSAVVLYWLLRHWYHSAVSTR